MSYFLRQLCALRAEDYAEYCRITRRLAAVQPAAASATMLTLPERLVLALRRDPAGFALLLTVAGQWRSGCTEPVYVIEAPGTQVAALMARIEALTNEEVPA